MVTSFSQQHVELLVPSAPWNVIVYCQDIDALPVLKFHFCKDKHCLNLNPKNRAVISNFIVIVSNTLKYTHSFL